MNTPVSTIFLSSSCNACSIDRREIKMKYISTCCGLYTNMESRITIVKVDDSLEASMRSIDDSTL